MIVVTFLFVTRDPHQSFNQHVLPNINVLAV